MINNTDLLFHCEKLWLGCCINRLVVYSKKMPSRIA